MKPLVLGLSALLIGLLVPVSPRPAWLIPPNAFCDWLCRATRLWMT